VVIVDNDGNAFWEVVTPRTVKETAKGFTILIPRSQPFDITAREELLKLAQRGERLVGSFPDFLAVLPPGAITPLERAAEVDPVAAARLADRLADGRAVPDMTAATVIGAPPSWLAASTAAQNLWLGAALWTSRNNCFQENNKRGSADSFQVV
jgi:hypothetical protein